MIDQDQKNLDLLAIFHYVVGGLTALFACIPFIHMFVGVAIVFNKLPDSGSGDTPPAFLGWVFIFVASLVILAGWSIAAVTMVAGRKLQLRQNRIFCIVIAAIQCAIMPFGTILGVFTIVVLNKESVIELFERNKGLQPQNQGITSR